MNGILIFGAAGSGTSTTARALAERLRYTHIDVDAYSWEETAVPKAGRTPHARRVPLLQKAMDSSAGFVMSGSVCGWGDGLIPRFNLAVFVTTPTDVRLDRLHNREYAQFGERILEGGDMHGHFSWFMKYAESYDTGMPPDRCRKLHEEWIGQLPCTVLRIDGAAPIEQNLNTIMHIIADTFDYTKWQRNLFADMSLEELVAEATEYCKTNHTH